MEIDNIMLQKYCFLVPRKCYSGKKESVAKTESCSTGY